MVGGQVALAAARFACPGRPQALEHLLLDLPGRRGVIRLTPGRGGVPILLGGAPFQVGRPMRAVAVKEGGVVLVELRGPVVRLGLMLAGFGVRSCALGRLRRSLPPSTFVALGVHRQSLLAAARWKGREAKSGDLARLPSDTRRRAGTVRRHKRGNTAALLLAKLATALTLTLTLTRTVRLVAQARRPVSQSSRAMKAKLVATASTVLPNRSLNSSLCSHCHGGDAILSA